MADPIEIKIVGKDDSEAALQSSTQGIRGLGDAAEKTTPKLKAMTDVQHRTNRIVGEGGRAFGDYGTGLGGVGDRFDEVDTRAMGLADGLAGLSDAQRWSTLTAQEQAMVFSDLGSTMYNAVIPTVQDLGGKLTGLIDKLGGVKGAAALAGGAAGIGVLIYAAKELEAANQRKVLDEMAEGFQAVNYEASEASMRAIRHVEAIGMLDEAFKTAEDSGGTHSRRLIDLAEKAGISADVIDHYRKEIDQAAAAEENNTEKTDDNTQAMEDNAEAIRGVTDARRAAIDPLFGMLDALEGTRDAQRGVAEAEHALREAVRQHGEGSAEAAAAQRDLNAAQDDAARSAFDYESAAGELEAQIREHPASLSNAKLALERWVAQGSISEEQARRMAIRFENAADRADDVAGTRTADLRARDNATSKIQSVGNQLGRLDGRNADVYITGHTVGGSVGQMLSLLSQARVSGGPVSAAAGGGPRGGTVLTGEGGPELLTNVAPGSMVHDAASTRRMLSGGSWGPLVLQWQGAPTDDLGRAIFDWFRDNIRDNYGGDPTRGLGA